MKCPICNGNKKCKICNGSGMVLKGFLVKKEKECSTCSGLGSCKFCRGTGAVDPEMISKNGEKAECYRCGAIVPISYPMCPNCGCEFE